MENQSSTQPAAPTLTSHERSVGMWMHLAPLLITFFNFMVPIPFLGLIAALILYYSHREKHGFVLGHGKESLNFQITLAIAWVIIFTVGALLMGRAFLGMILNNTDGNEFDLSSGLSMAFSVLPLVALSFAVWLFSTIVMVVASIRANDGKMYRYPISIRFVS
jgi:uncharacterized protein